MGEAGTGERETELGRFFGIAESGYDFFLKGALRAPFKKKSYIKPATPVFSGAPQSVGKLPHG